MTKLRAFDWYRFGLPSSLVIGNSSFRQRSCRSFLPNVAHAVTKPAGRDDFLLCVELHAFFSLNVKIPVKGFVPTGEWKHGHGRGHADIDSGHSGFDPMFEFAGCFSRVCKYGGAIPI